MHRSRRPAPEFSQEASLCIDLFGHFRVRADGSELLFERSRRAQPLLVYLLLHREAAIPRDFLAFTLYPEVGDTEARNHLRRNLYVLQRALPEPRAAAPWIESDGGTIRWNADADCLIDVVEFERKLETAPADAVALYRGDLLEGEYDEWLFGERERLRTLYLATLTELLHAARRERRFADAIAFGNRLLAAEPLREDAARAVMAARYESGDRGGALADFRAFAERLHAELGADPMPETLGLRDAIRRGAAIDVVAAAEVRAGTGFASAAGVPFVGRGDALERLSVSWNRAARGRGETVFLSGEAGIGKTRLAAEFARRVESEGARVLRGGTTAHADAPYEAIAEALGSAAALLGTLDIEPLWLRVVAAICLELAPACAGFPALPPIAPERERTRLFDGVARCLAALAGPRPLFVLLEDMHWASVASSEMLRFLALRAASRRILVLVTFREEDAPRTHPVRALRHDLLAARVASSLSLRPLAAGETAALVEALAGGSRDDGLAARIHGQSAGNPLFVVQLARDFAECERSPADGRSTTLDGVIAARLDRVGEAARKCADVAACLGGDFDVDLVAGVLGWTEAEVVASLDELLARHVVRESSARSLFAYGFTHDLVRVAAYDRIGDERRRRYHLLLARALEARDAAHALDLAAELAHHYEQGGARAQAAAWWLRAASRALERHAPDEAEDFATRALALEPERDVRVSLLGVRETANGRRGRRDEQERDIAELLALIEDGDVERRCDALARRVSLAGAVDGEGHAHAIVELRRYAEAHGARRWIAFAALSDALRALALRSAPEAEVALREALHLSEEGGDLAEVARTRAILAKALAEQGRFAEAGDELARARPLLAGVDDPLLRLAFLDADGAVSEARQDFTAARDTALESLATAHACGDRLGEARALFKLSQATVRLYDVAAWSAYNATARELFEAIDYAAGARWLEHNGAAFETSLGRPEFALRRLRALREDAEQRSDRAMMYYTTSNIGVALFALGRYREACDEETNALALARELGNETMCALVLGDLGIAQSALGRHAEGIASLAASVEILGRLNVIMSVVNNSARLALVHARSGDLAAAAADARFVVDAYAKHPARVEEPPEVFWYVAQAFRAAGMERESADALRVAGNVLDERLQRLDEPYRTSYAAVRWHRELTAARAEGGWPPLDPSGAGVA